MVKTSTILATVFATAAALSGCRTVDAGSGAGSHLTAEQVAAIAHACEQLSLQYSSYIDTGDYVHLPSVFTPDGVWQVQGNRSEGREAIGEYWKSRVARRKPEDGSRALVTNQRIDVVDADHATGSSYFTIFRYAVGAPSKSLAPAVFTKSSDEYVRTADGWRLKLRRIETVAEVVN